MRWAWFVAALALAAATKAKESSETVGEDLPPELSALNFTSGNPAGTWLLKFYSPYCSHCTAMQPKWAAAYSDLGGSENAEANGLHWGSVNCVEHGDLCMGSEGIASFPTLRVYKDGKRIYDYTSKPVEYEPLRDFALRYVVNGESALSADSEKPLPKDPATRLRSLNHLEGPWIVLFDGDEHLKWMWDTKALGDGPKYGTVDCTANSDLCNEVTTRPHIRLYDGPKVVGDHSGPWDIPTLLGVARRSGRAGSSSVSPLDSGSLSPSVDDAVKYSEATVGQKVEVDPGTLVFGDQPEYMHGFRTWASPNAPAPGYNSDPFSATISHGKVLLLSPTDVAQYVFETGEPWMMMFTEAGTVTQAFVDAAESFKDRINFAAIDCSKHKEFCTDQGALHFPYIAFYRGPVALSEFRDTNIIEYTTQAAESQIQPVGGVEELKAVLESTNVPVFLYISDESAMPEDWDSAVDVALGLRQKFKGVVLRSDSPQVREDANIHHRGMSFVHVELVSGEVRAYSMPQSDIPSVMRNTKRVVDWAFGERFSSAQPLSPVGMASWAPLVCVHIGMSTAETEWMKRLAADFHFSYLDRQRRDQEALRLERMRQHDIAAGKGQHDYARRIYKTPIQARIRPDMAFGLVSGGAWDTRYSAYIDTSRVPEGSVAVIDFYNGKFIHVPTRDLDWDTTKEHISEASEALLGRRKGENIISFRRSIRDIPVPPSVEPPVFVLPRTKTGDVFHAIFWFMFGIVFGIIVVFVLWRLCLLGRLGQYLDRLYREGKAKYGDEQLLPKHE